ncbi:MAG: C4-dicarboxylate transporter [Frankiales bacterium]|nr:C4-dicarboxylate transporter [Frankiales bacterium]
MTITRVPANLFGIGFGLAGLATTWQVAAGSDLAPTWPSTVLVVVAALVWLSSLTRYLQYCLRSPGALGRDLHDMTTGPFLSLALITPMLLAADGVTPLSRTVARVLVDVLVVLVVLLGGWFTGTWMRGGTELDRLHPGYFLPTVAGGLVASASASDVDQARLAEAMLGLGMVCWAIVGSMILGRLVFRPPLPDALVPTLAIEVAPAAVASVAYLSINDGRVDLFAAGLAGYGLLMIAAQGPLLARYLRLTFSLGTWAFTFSWAAVASALLLWIRSGGVAVDRVLGYLVLAAITALVGGIAGRTLMALGRGALLPAAAGPATATATAAPVPAPTAVPDDRTPALTP